MAFTRANKSYAVPIPNIPDNSFNFKFNVTLPDGIHNFTFNWIWYNPEGGLQNAWYFTDQMPNGNVRSGRVSPNCCNWQASTDMGIYFKSSLNNVGQNDLGSVSMYALYWL